MFKKKSEKTSVVAWKAEAGGLPPGLQGQPGLHTKTMKQDISKNIKQAKHKQKQSRK